MIPPSMKSKGHKKRSLINLRAAEECLENTFPQGAIKTSSFTWGWTLSMKFWQFSLDVTALNGQVRLVFKEDVGSYSHTHLEFQKLKDMPAFYTALGQVQEFLRGVIICLSMVLGDSLSPEEMVEDKKRRILASMKIQKPDPT